jgi:hypothetical protein
VLQFQEGKAGSNLTLQVWERGRTAGGAWENHESKQFI